jgi:hypothetical protein
MIEKEIVTAVSDNMVWLNFSAMIKDYIFLLKDAFFSCSSFF